MRSKLSNLLKIIEMSEVLKSEKRHCWLKNGDQESVASHIYRLGLMAYLFSQTTDYKLNMEKVCKMVLVHDLGEAKVGDIPAFTIKGLEQKRDKEQKEREAFEEIREILEVDLGKEVYDLWEEFEKRETLEAKYVFALDRLESYLQHYQSDSKTWLDIEKKRFFLGFSVYCEHDKSLIELNELIREKMLKKLKKECPKDFQDLKKWYKENSMESLLKETAMI